MREWQLDLFSASGIPPENHAQPNIGQPEIVPADLDDDALIAAIPAAGIADAPALAAEAGRRRLVAAIAALEQLCLRFAGFGLERAVPEQVAALQALALIGGPESAQTVARLITRSIVQGPTRKVAVGIAAQLRSALPAETALALLQHADPEVRADACRCTGAWPAAIPVLLELTDDSDGNVRVAAFCALGRLGSREARPALTRLLRDAPSLEIIEAMPRIADEDCVILLGRIVRTQPALADAARDALEMIDHPRARQIAAIAAERDRPDAGN
ncbi:MAG: HEAT repeat domain-containing protein [Geminicoccaceae bacterium]